MKTIAERLSELQAECEELAGPGEPVFAAISCDGCGWSLLLDPAAPDAPGWKLGPPDYCPDCA